MENLLPLLVSHNHKNIISNPRNSLKNINNQPTSQQQHVVDDARETNRPTLNSLLCKYALADINISVILPFAAVILAGLIFNTRSDT